MTAMVDLNVHIVPHNLNKLLCMYPLLTYPLGLGSPKLRHTNICNVT